MSRLSDIPIIVEPAPARPTTDAGEPGLGAGSAAILVEIAALLERLTEAKLEGAIDLHSMPMTEADRRKLQLHLGKGEVRAFLDADGTSEFQETAVPGIWWIQHRNQSGEIIAELIEVTSFPAILARAEDEIATSLQILGERGQLLPKDFLHDSQRER